MDFVIDLDKSEQDSFYRPSSSSSEHFSSFYNDEQTFSFAQEKGSRRKMQDKLNITRYEDSIAFSVFDGHGSQKVAAFLEENMPIKLVEAAKGSDENLKQVFREMDNLISKSNFKNDGSTALSVIINKNFTKICNVGDSRAIMVSKNGGVFQITEDQNTQREDEISRIQQLGGWVLPVGNILRVQGSLAVTRSFGDSNLKPFISSEPEIYNFDVKAEHKYLVIATDGLWNVISQLTKEISNSDVAKFLSSYEGKNPAFALIKEVRRRKEFIGDNVSVIIVDLEHLMN